MTSEQWIWAALIITQWLTLCAYFWHQYNVLARQCEIHTANVKAAQRAHSEYRVESDAKWAQFVADVGDAAHLNLDKRIDRVFAEFEDLYQQGKFNEANEKIRNWSIAKEPFQLTASVLTKTHCVRDKCPARADMAAEIDKIMEHLR